MKTSTAPHLRDLRDISVDYCSLHVLHNGYWPLIVNGWPQTFRVLRVWCGDARETCAVSCVFSLN